MRLFFSFLTVMYLVFASNSFAIDNLLSQDVVKNYVTNSGFENGLAPHSTASSLGIPYAIVTSPVRSGFKALHFVSSETASTTLTLVSDTLPSGDNFNLYFYYISSIAVPVDLRTYSGTLIESFLLAPCVSYCRSPVKTVTGNQRYKFFINGITDIYIDDFRAERENSTIGSIVGAYPITASTSSGLVTIGITSGDFPVSTLTVNSKVKVGTNDAYSRGQIWNYLTNSILRLGSLGQDGDAVGDNSSEGFITYGNDPQTSSMTSEGGNFGYARVKPDRFGLYKSTANNAGYYFRVDPTALYLTDNSYNKTFNVDRLTGNIKTSMSSGYVVSDASGNLTVTAGPGMGLTGSGTAGKISKWAGSSSLTDSSLSDDGSTLTIDNVDVNTTAGKFVYLGSPTVDGSIRYSNASGALLVEKRISGVWTELMTIDEN